MGAAESNPVRNLDKRTARRQYSKDFSYAVERYRKPGPGKLVSAEVKSRMLSDVKAVVIGLAD